MNPKRSRAPLNGLPAVIAYQVAREPTSSGVANPVRRRRPQGRKPNWKLVALLLLCLAQAALCHGQDAGQDASQDAGQDARQDGGHDAGQDAKVQTAAETPQLAKPHDFNTDIYYRNKLEFSLETGGLPINIPFVFDVFEGGDYSQKPLHYTLVPIVPSLRWQMGNVRGPWILRGNTDLTVSLSVTAIPRGPEKVYGAFDLGVRRNFVYRNWKATPYFEFRTGAGFIDAQQPHGVQFAQGEDYTFTLWLGVGLRYNFNPKWSMSLGPTYMHVSNLYLSEPRYEDYGINVVGGVVGFNMRLGRPKQSSAH